ncbi:MAG: immunoglobulin-like domain-containing protein, partial [Cellulosimicrobium funkei]
VVSASGAVTRPAGDEPASATLSATVTLRVATATRSFDVTVLPGDGDQA